MPIGFSLLYISFCIFRWFERFKQRNRIAFRATTNKSQTTPANHVEAIRRFHHFIRRNAKRGEIIAPTGKWDLSSIANMDQTPIPFDFNNGKTYDAAGAKTVWVRNTKSGLDKRQATAQLTIYADGVKRVKPLVIFRGKGTRISTKEKSQWDHRVVVQFQPNAWADEKVMKFWFRHMWKPHGFKEKPRLLVADVHKSQKTVEILRIVREECNTTMAIVPAGKASSIGNFEIELSLTLLFSS